MFEYPPDAQPSTNTDYLAMGITTIQTSHAKILRIDSEDNDDFIELELVNVLCILCLMETGSVVIKFFI